MSLPLHGNNMVQPGGKLPYQLPSLEQKQKMDWVSKVVAYLGAALNIGFCLTWRGPLRDQRHLKTTWNTGKNMPHWNTGRHHGEQEITRLRKCRDKVLREFKISKSTHTSPEKIYPRKGLKSPRISTELIGEGLPRLEASS